MQKQHMIGTVMEQNLLFDGGVRREIEPFRSQLLKWVGNKQRFAAMKSFLIFPMISALTSSPSSEAVPSSEAYSRRRQSGRSNWPAD